MNINLVLSGGGARGLAHLGIIKVLQETGFVIQHISGVSSGAVVSAFICAGFSPEETLKVFMENNLMYRIRPVFNAGIFKLSKWEEILLKHFPKNTFESLGIPLTVNATDINECKEAYFSSGELVTPLLASCSLPGIFEPIVINNRQYVDGGILNNLPVEPFLSGPNKTIALNVNPLTAEESIDSAFKIFDRSFQLALRDKTNQNKKKAHLVIEPDALSKYQIFDLGEGEDIFKVGYDHASSLRKDLESLIKSA